MQVERYPGYDYVSLAHQFSIKKCYPFIVTVSPEKEPAKMNKHNGHEFDYVLQGSLKCKIGEKEIILEEGIASISIPCIRTAYSPIQISLPSSWQLF